MDLKPADPSYEQTARELFPLDMSPEEYAARQAHLWAMFSFDCYSYSDPALHAWIHRFGVICRGGPGVPSIEALRKQFLSEHERAAIEAQEQRWASGEEDF